MTVMLVDANAEVRRVIRRIVADRLQHGRRRETLHRLGQGLHACRRHTQYTVGVSGGVGVEGADVAFDANSYTLSGAVGPVVHTWQFQKEGCISGNMPCWTLDPVTFRLPRYIRIR